MFATRPVEMLTFYSIFSIISVALFAVYLYLKNLLNYWERKEVVNVPTNVFTALYNLYFNPIPLIQYYGDIYNRLSGHKYGGCFTSFQRQFVIRDPQLMKAILIKDFDYFRDRGSVYFNKYDKVTHVLFILPGTLLWRSKYAYSVIIFEKSQKIKL